MIRTLLYKLLAQTLASLLLVNLCFSGLDDFRGSETPLNCTSEFFTECSAEVEALDASVLTYNCDPRKTPDEIEPNHRECYRTCAFEDGFFPSCARCLSAETGDGALLVQNQDFYNVYSLRSPGGNLYLAKTICNYRVQCDTGQSMFYTILNHQLQPHIFVFGQQLCPDILSVSNSNQANFNQITCGDIDSDDEQASGFSLQDLFVTFESNGEKQYEGFFMLAFCVNDSVQEREGCTVTGEGRTARAADPRHKRSFRVPYIKVKPGQVVRYKDYTLTVESAIDERVFYRFHNILVLQTYNQFERYVTYRRSAEDREFPGFGELQIGKGIAHYIQTDINPNFLMSAEEIAIINSFLGNLTKFRFFEDEKFGLPLPNAGPQPPPTPPPIQCDELLDTVSELIRVAESERNNCRAFVSAAAEFFLGTVREQCRSP